MKKRTLVILAALIFLVGFTAETIRISARADEQLIQAWILCKPGDYVNARISPSRKSNSMGRFNVGDSVQTSARSKNGFLYCKVDLEAEYGWIYAGYVTTSQPIDYGGKECPVVSNGRVAVRKCIEGDRTGWLVNGSIVKVYAVAGDWAVTNRGYVRSEYLNLGGR